MLYIGIINNSENNRVQIAYCGSDRKQAVTTMFSAYKRDFKEAKADGGLEEGSSQYKKKEFEEACFDDRGSACIQYFCSHTNYEIHEIDNYDGRDA